jgi:hypothetical protein
MNKVLSQSYPHDHFAFVHNHGIICYGNQEEDVSFDYIKTEEGKTAVKLDLSTFTLSGFSTDN